MKAHGPLAGLKVIDLTRVLAGPVCTQLLGDMGADIYKIERPGIGDDTRLWGPPFLKDAEGNNTSESAYYLAANRNKHSITLDLATEADSAKLHAMLADADVLIENFKPGSLEKLGFGYTALHEKYPRLVYCSITGFGQTGPLSAEAGYDFMVQGMCGLMSITGEIDGPPGKTGIAVVDYVTGLNASIGILAALRARDVTGEGQMIDMALFDSALAMMTNIAQYTLTSGRNPPRVGNAHTTIMPYNAFEAADGWIVLAVGNDHQFQKFAHFAEHREWGDDPRFSTNAQRVTNRDILTPLISNVIKARKRTYWIDGLMAAGVPCGPILSMKEALDHPQTAARDMVIAMDHPLAAAPIRLVGSPYKLSDTPVTYRMAPPTNGNTKP